MSRTLASEIQERLCDYYGIDGAPAVDAFVRPTEGVAREALLIREFDDAIELALHLPQKALEPGRGATRDCFCQVVEGVSHFLYVAERARRELPTTRLELELQAEVDKYVMLVAGDAGAGGAPVVGGVRGASVRADLFERVTFLHDRGTEEGERYRLANQLAARYARALERRFLRHGRFDAMRAALRRFYRAGQTEKIALAQAA